MRQEIELTALKDSTNGGEPVIIGEMPYVVQVTIEGVAALLFHAWNCEAVEAKAKARKGSVEKKSDNLESYVYRSRDGTLGIPGRNVVGSLTDPKNGAAKFLQDPRSPRKSALDLYKAGVISLTDVASLGVSNWDYVDRQRVQVQRAGITRSRPAMNPGWKATFDIQVMLPEYIKPHDLHQAMIFAGRLVGIGDYRPTYGRFVVTEFKIAQTV